MTPIILVCDASRARFFQLDRDSNLQLKEEVDNPPGRAHGQDLLSDAPGRSRKGGGILTAMEPHTPPHEVESKRFALRLAQQLHASLDRQEFDSLVIVAPPHFLGLMHAALSPEVVRRLVNSVPKDLTHMDRREVMEHLGKHPTVAECKTKWLS